MFKEVEGLEGIMTRAGIPEGAVKELGQGGGSAEEVGSDQECRAVWAGLQVLATDQRGLLDTVQMYGGVSWDEMWQ